MDQFESLAIHGNNSKIGKIGECAPLRTPIYDNAAFGFSSSEEIAKAFRGESSGFSYSRISNPTVAQLQSRLKCLSGAEDVLCVSSGMAAISTLFLSLLESGENIITNKYIFGNTYSLFEHSFKKFGIETQYVDLDNPKSIIEAINPKTRMIFLENITNPLLDFYDIEAISQIAKEHNILFIVDNTLPTPYLFHAKDWDVDIEILSNTKSISGGGTGIGGSILLYRTEKYKSVPALAESYEKWEKKALFKRLIKEIYRNMGCCLSPQNASMQLLGIETLSLRVDRAGENATELAHFMTSINGVKKVAYPGLPNFRKYHLIQKYMGGNGGQLILFELASKKHCFDFMDRLKMISRATNFCDNKSLIIHPESTIFCEYSEDEKSELGINERMMRLSVGIENIADIIDDIKQAL